MTHDEAHRYLASLVNHEQRAPTSRDFVLEPIRQLLARFDNPQNKLLTIHITGTKGKGSVAWMLESILRQAGYITGLYTSPELNHFNERIRIQGIPIEDESFAEILADIRNAIPNIQSQPTYFDVTTALAFIHFARANVDVAIIEVGMGGRTDSTNICKPNVAVITSISYDHTQQLGHTLEAIAREKAGIIKPGCAVVSGVTVPEARAVIEETCREKGVSLRQIGIDFTYEYHPPCVVVDEREYRLALLGEHQAANAAVVLATVDELRKQGMTISNDHKEIGLASVQYPARIELVRKNPHIIVDCAHNVASISALIKTLNTSFVEHPKSKRILIFSASRDKDIAGMLSILSNHFDRIYLTSYSRSSRSATREELYRACPEMNAEYYQHPEDALNAVMSVAKPDEMIVITGSVFLAGELRELIVSQNNPLTPNPSPARGEGS